MRVATPIQTDNGEVQSIIGTHDLAVTFCRSSHGQTRSPHCQCVEKLTSCNHRCSFSRIFNAPLSASESTEGLTLLLFDFGGMMRGIRALVLHHGLSAL